MGKLNLSWNKALSLSMLIHCLILGLLFLVGDGFAKEKVPEYQVIINLQNSKTFSANNLNKNANLETIRNTNNNKNSTNDMAEQKVTSSNFTQSQLEQQTNLVGHKESGSLATNLASVNNSVLNQEDKSPGTVTASKQEFTCINLDGFLDVLERHKKYPYLASKRGVEGTVTVLMKLDPQGNLLSAIIEDSSGSELLDKAALKSIQASCPYQHGTGGYVQDSVPIVYRLLN